MQAGTVGRTILIDSYSVHQCKNKPHRVGRVWADTTAWAALALLSGESVHWLSSSERWRLRKRLEQLRAEEIHQLARNRARLRRFRGSDSAKRILTKSLVLTGTSLLANPEVATSFELATGEGIVEGYAKPAFIETNARKLGLREDPTGDILIRETDFVEAIKNGHVPLAVIALDLQDARSVRERSAGLAKLEDLLRDW
ncbi:DNA-binding protein [Arthrobacter sp. MYb213]|nr:DNA-binding protein [Arthrobacter sp. MYb213]